MHVLSCVMGYALPALLPRAYTHFFGAVLFAYFGLKLLYDARAVYFVEIIVCCVVLSLNL